MFFGIHFDLISSFILVQALLEAMGASGPPGQEAVANAEINAAILTARAGARDPSAIPSICRVSAALQYPAGKYMIVCDLPIGSFLVYTLQYPSICCCKMSLQ